MTYWMANNGFVKMSANRHNAAELSVNVLHCSNLSELNSEVFFPSTFCLYLLMDIILFPKVPQTIGQH